MVGESNEVNPFFLQGYNKLEPAPGLVGHAALTDCNTNSLKKIQKNSHLYIFI